MNTTYQCMGGAPAFSKYKYFWIILPFNEIIVTHNPYKHSTDLLYFACEIIYFIHLANTVEGWLHLYEREAKIPSCLTS